jgi:hypothetical protein
MSHQPHPPLVGSIAVPIVFAVFALGFLVFSTGAMDEHTPAAFRFGFMAVPVLMIAISIGIAAKGARFAAAPIRRELAVVVDERTQVSGGGQNSSVSTSYYATLQSRDGMRIEYGTYGWLAGRIAATDIGVAFIKGDRLVDFLTLHVG